MKKSIFRLLVCLVLVCVILVNCSPIRAEAVAFSTFALVSGLTVLGSCLIGLGLAAGDNQEAFYEVCSMIAQHPKILPYFDADGNIRIPRFNLEDGELSPWLVPAVLLQAIREVIYENGVIEEIEMPEGYVSYGDYVFPSFSSSRKYLVLYTYGNYLLYGATSDIPRGRYYNNPFGTSNWYFYASGSSKVIYSYRLENGSWVSEGSSNFGLTYGEPFVDIVWSNFDFLDYDTDEIICPAGTIDDFISAEIGTDYDLTLFDVAPLDQELAQGYPNWALGQLQDEDEEVWYPLGFGNTLDETLGLTQQQVQLGEGTFEQTQDQDQEQTQTNGLIQTFMDKVTTWFARISLNLFNVQDQLSNQLSQEQSQAQTQGGQAVDNVIQIIPDDSKEYLTAMSSLISVLSYEGTEAVITMPAITVPAIGSSIPEITYLDEQSVNLEEYVNMLPDWLLLLIRYLFDVALVLYCLKEFMGVIHGLVNNFSDAKEVIYE